MYILIAGWGYVVLMMAVAEAVSPQGSVLGAIFTFVLYGAFPLAIATYLLGTPARKRRLRAREAAEREAAMAAGSAPPDGGGEAPGNAVPPVREKE